MRCAHVRMHTRGPAVGRQQPLPPAQVIAISKAQPSEDMAEPAEVAAHAAPAP